MAEPPIPDFLQGTFCWEDRGYSYAAPPPPDLLAAPALSSGNPWIRLAAVLECAKLGKWDSLRRLEGMVVVAEHLLLRAACAELLGHASSDSHLRAFVPTLLSASDDLRLEACRSLYCAGTLSHIPLAVEAWKLCREPDAREEISSMLSDLLEPTAGHVFTYGTSPDDEFYARYVVAVGQRLAETLGTDSVPVWKGSLFGVVPLARRMQALLADPRLTRPGVDVDLMDYRQRFETATGIDCSTFFKDERAQPLAAAATIEAFLDGPDAAKYEDGFRYFFGHRIPD